GRPSAKSPPAAPPPMPKSPPALANQNLSAPSPERLPRIQSPWQSPVIALSAPTGRYAGTVGAWRVNGLCSSTNPSDEICLVPQTFLSAVSQVFQPAGLPKSANWKSAAQQTRK